MSVAVRQATQSPVRIQTSASGTPLVAVTVQQPAGVQSQGIPTVVTAQQQHSIANPTTQSGNSQEAVRHKFLLLLLCYRDYPLIFCYCYMYARSSRQISVYTFFQI